MADLFPNFNYFKSRCPPKAEDSAWAHCDVVEGKMVCKLCQKCIGGGGILRCNVTPCDAPKAVLGLVRAEYLAKPKNFEETKAREKAIQDEIARKREIVEMLRESGYENDIQDSTPIPSTNNPFHYVPPVGKRSKPTKKPNLMSYFSSTTNPTATASMS